MKAAMELAGLAVLNGWTIKIAPQEDTGGHPFVTVEGIRGLDAYFSATWHTQDTGTYRLFRSSCGKSRQHSFATSLRRVKEVVIS